MTRRSSKFVYHGAGDRALNGLPTVNVSMVWTKLDSSGAEHAGWIMIRGGSRDD